MSTPTDLETRISIALAGRAEQVQPEHLSPRSVPVAPPRRRTPVVVLAVAASILLAVVLSLDLGTGERRVAPAPAPSDPEVVVPPDVGRGWDRAKTSPTVRLDLDGDGAEEKVRFLAEPSKEYDGRIRLQTTLSSDGSDAYGLVDVGTTLGLDAHDPIDADADGDQELVLYYGDPQDGMTTLPMVLDLRDGVLVETPPSQPDLLRNGTARAAGGTDHYDMVHLVEYWIEDGTLHSSRSVRSFATLGMSLFRPREYEADAYVWRLGEEGVLRPDAAPQPCLRKVEDRRRACAPGESDSLPVLAPVADERIAIGEGASFDEGYRFDVRLEPAVAGSESDATVVVEGGDGRRLEHHLRLGAEPRVFTQQPSGVFYDGASMLVASEDGDEPSSMQVLVQRGAELEVLEVVGDVPLGTGYTGDEGHAFRTWLNQDGALLTAVADTAEQSGPWTVSSWVMLDRRTMVAAPLDTVCFDDPTDPATARRC